MSRKYLFAAACALAVGGLALWTYVTQAGACAADATAFRDAPPAGPVTANSQSALAGAIGFSRIDARADQAFRSSVLKKVSGRGRRACAAVASEPSAGGAGANGRRRRPAAARGPGQGRR